MKPSARDSYENRRADRLAMIIVALLIALLGLVAAGRAQQPAEDPGALTTLASWRMKNSALLDRFYTGANRPEFWFGEKARSTALRNALFGALDSGIAVLPRDGWFSANNLRWIAAAADSTRDSAALIQADRLFSLVFLTVAMNTYRGFGIASMISSDEISARYTSRDEAFVLGKIAGIRSGQALAAALRGLEPANAEYARLKTEWRVQFAEGDADRLAKLEAALNLNRWIGHLGLDTFVVVNIPAATLVCYVRDSVALFMKAVVGRPATPTPRIATWCDKLVLYPYWNVPASIGRKEFFPLFRANPALPALMNMQIIDGKGNNVDPLQINWNAYSAKNFPYRFRQSTGCDNALGLIKFNLTSPYDVYMHDTNTKSGFSGEARFYSHGCVRLEKPVQLAVLLAGERFDATALLGGSRRQAPREVRLPAPVPVFFVYAPVAIDGSGRIAYFDDIYRLLQTPN